MSIEFRYSDFLTPVAILRLKRAFDHSQWHSPEESEREQTARLRAMLRHGERRVPYVREALARAGLRAEDVRATADLARLPVLSKEALRREYPRLCATDAWRWHPRAVQTSGTTGAPVRVLIGHDANALEFVHYWRHWGWAGYRLGDAFAELSSACFLKDPALSRVPWVRQPMLGRLLLNSLSLDAARVTAFRPALERHRPRFLKGTVSALTTLAALVGDPAPSAYEFRAVFSTGEMLHPHQRRVIERAFGGKVYDSYGHMERTIAISECPHGRLHVESDYGIAELADVPASRAEAPALVAGPEVRVARLLGTGLHNHAMPLLRYEVGDLVEVDRVPRPCPCGRRMPQVRRVLGREVDVIAVPGGGVIPSLFVAFDEVPGVLMAQVVQERIDRVRIRVVRANDFTTGTEAMLRESVRRASAGRLAVELEYVAAGTLTPMDGSKFRPVVSRLGRNESPVALAASGPST